MTPFIDAVRAFVTPLLTGWVVQSGRWMDAAKTARYAVLKPAGGMPAELVREPSMSLLLVGRENDEVSVPGYKADEIIEAMRASSGSLVFLQPAEPVFWATNDGRPVFEIAISAITN